MTGEITTIHELLAEVETILSELREKHSEWCSLDRVYEELGLSDEILNEIRLEAPDIPAKWLNKSGRKSLRELNKKVIQRERDELRGEAIRLYRDHKYVTVEELNDAFRDARANFIHVL